jgi:predicted enzyme related to lactoylglutathione lyase
MPTVTTHAPGTFCWPELSTSDPIAAKKFYSGLFGWQIKDQDMGPQGVYTIFHPRWERRGGLLQAG